MSEKKIIQHCSRCGIRSDSYGYCDLNGCGGAMVESYRTDDAERMCFECKDLQVGKFETTCKSDGCNGRVDSYGAYKTYIASIEKNKKSQNEVIRCIICNAIQPIQSQDGAFCVSLECGGRVHTESKIKEFIESNRNPQNIQIKLHQDIEPMAQMISALFDLMNCEALKVLPDASKLIAMHFVIDIRTHEVAIPITDNQNLINETSSKMTESLFIDSVRARAKAQSTFFGGE